MVLGIITGSGFYDFPELRVSAERSVETEFGRVTLRESELSGHRVYFIARHGSGHASLPHMINYRGNIDAMKRLGAEIVVSASVMGVLDPDIPLATTLLFDDLHFPENRLPSGETCSMFTTPGEPRRGHYIFSSPFSAAAKKIAAGAAQKENIPFRDGLVYAHVNGPRFNSRTEIRALRTIGCSAVSQTAGPEIVLSGECGMASLLLGFGVDYANGIAETPTPVAVLDENMKKSRDTLACLVLRFIGGLPKKPEKDFFDSGFVYRFN